MATEADFGVGKVNGKARFQANPDVDILEKMLEKRQNEKLISYADMSAAISRDITKKARYLLQTARNRLERRGLTFTAVTREGLRKLEDEEKPEYLCDARRNIHRAAKRTIRRAAVSDITKLDTAKRALHVVGMSHMALVSMATTVAAGKKIAAIGCEAQKPTALLLEALKE